MAKLEFNELNEVTHIILYIYIISLIKQQCDDKNDLFKSHI